MSRYLRCLLLLQVCGTLLLAQRTVLDNPANILVYRLLRNWTFGVLGSTGSEARLLNAADDCGRVQEKVPDYVPFPCNVTNWRSTEPPELVNRLKPGDIDIIGALGDSLTAGAGAFASNVLQIVIENRGATTFAGGQATWREYLTLPNIFKEFNKDLYGYALGDSLTSHEISKFNVAESGAMSKDLPYMAEILVKRIKNSPKVNLKKHWKYISIMIGSNDFCTEMCWIPSPWSLLTYHKENLVKTLRILRDNLPRTFVSIIPSPNLKVLVDSAKFESTLKCDLTRNFECSCLFGLVFRSQRPIYYEIMSKWQKLEMEIAKYPEFHTKDFTVVAQPVTLNVTLPLTSDGYPDMTYLSSDCFHFSQKTNARFANVVWNSLLMPENEKPYDWEPTFEKFVCPTPENPYLSTYTNILMENTIK